MRVLRKEAAGKYLLFCLALVPALLFAYLGQFSRLMPDDYKYLGKPVEIGIWQALHYFRGTWHGGYTNFLLYGLLAPRGVEVPSIFPLSHCRHLACWLGIAVSQRFGILGNQATSLLNSHRASFAHGCGRYQRNVFATIVLLVYGNCRIHLAASPAFALLDTYGKDSRASAHPFPACDCGDSCGYSRFRHCRLLGNVPGLSAGISRAPNCWS